MRRRAGRLAGTMLVPALAVLVPLAAAGAADSSGGATTLGTLVLPAVGPGYVVLSQGAVDPTTFASSAPDPAAVSSALASLSGRVRSYQRTWTDTARLNAVQDMVFAFPNAASAQIFLQSAQKSLQSGKIVTSGAVPGLPGARRVTYFGATDQAGVGQAITQRVGDHVVLLSFFSASNGNAAPITQADATEIAAAQERSLHAAQPGAATVPNTGHPDSGVTRGVVLAVVVVVVLGLALGGVLLIRQRRARREPPGSPAT
jgi:hypothetical protein